MRRQKGFHLGAKPQRETFISEDLYHSGGVDIVEEARYIEEEQGACAVGFLGGLYAVDESGDGIYGQVMWVGSKLGYGQKVMFLYVPADAGCDYLL